MNKQYIRNGLEYYMEVEPIGGEEYEYQMLMKNTIPSLLPLQLDQVNHKQYLMYTASGLKPFWITSEKMWISGRQICSIVDSLLETIKEIKKYLLIADNLVLDPESLFLDLSGFQLHFLYIPGYDKDIVNQMAQLMEYLLGKIDYEDSEGVVFAYGLYRIVKEPTVNLEEIQSYVEQFVEGKEKKSTKLEIENKILKEQNQEDSLLKQRDVEFEAISKANNEVATSMGLHQKKSWKLIFSVSLWSILFLGITVILYFIYVYGIEVWKRNILLFLGFSLLADSMIVYVLWKKRRQEKEISEVFQTTSNTKNQLTGEYQKPTVNVSQIQPMVYYKDQPGNQFEFQETMVLNEEQMSLAGSLGEMCKMVEIGEGNCREIIIRKLPFVIGNYSAGVDYCLEERQISRFHAVISEQEGEFYIKDLHSTNGTYVNEVKLEPEKEKNIRNNDWIKIADLRFRFVIVSA